MFEKLFKRPSVVTRHENAPYAEERRRYLVHCAASGYAHNSILFFARELLWMARKKTKGSGLELTSYGVRDYFFPGATRAGAAAGRFRGRQAFVLTNRGEPGSRTRFPPFGERAVGIVS